MQMISSILSKDEMYVGIQIKATHEMRLLRIKNPHCYFVSPYWLSLSPCMVVLLAGPDTYRLDPFISRPVLNLPPQPAA